MAMDSSEILDLRDELLEKEKELSGMQNLLLEQDEDIRGCQQRLRELESTLLLGCPPSSTASNTGDEDICPHAPASPPHPAQRTLYETSSTEAAVTSDAEEDEQSEDAGEHPLRSSSSQEPSPSPSGGGANTPSTTETAGEARSAGEDRSPHLDVYGRRLDRSFQLQEEENEPIADKERDIITADVGSRDDQHPCVDGRPIAAGRVVLAERRAEAAEAAARDAVTAAVTATSEARAANDEAERLRAEGVELSRWREAVLNLRDVLESARREGHDGGADGREDQRMNGPVARHAKWVSSPALKTLLPRLHQNARDLLADLAAARGPGTPAATATLKVAGVAGQGECTRLVAAMERPLGEVSSTRETGSDGEGSSSSVDMAMARTLMANDETEKQLASLRKECKTSRIVIHALRKKDEESQKQIFALEGQVFQASLAAVKQEALVSTLRKQLELNGSRDSPGQRPQFLTPRHTVFSVERSAPVVSGEVQDDSLARTGLCQRLSRLRDEMVSPLEAPTSPSVSLSPPRRNNTGPVPEPGDVRPGRSCCNCRGATPLGATPAAQSSVHDRRQGGAEGGADTIGGNSTVDNTDIISVEEEVTRRHPCGKPRTPTTDILRRLLYENSPGSLTSGAAESGGKTGRIADEEDCERTERMARRSRNGRRLFAEGSNVLRSCPAASGDVAGARRGPTALFSDPAYGIGEVEAKTGGCSGVLAVRGIGEDGAGKATLQGAVNAVVGKAVSHEVDQKGDRIATGEIVLRGRLLQARKEFSALRTGALIDSS